MSININIHTTREPDAISAHVVQGGSCPVRIDIKGQTGWPYEIYLYTGSLALSDALAEAINGVMARFAKPAAAPEQTEPESNWDGIKKGTAASYGPSKETAA